MRVSIREFLGNPSLDEHAVTRPFGRTVYRRLAEALKRTREHELIRFEIPTGLLMDYSFCDETLGRVYKELATGEWGNLYIITEVASELQFDNLVASIRLRKAAARVFFQDQYHLIVAEDRKGLDELTQTIDLVDRYRRITAADLARDHGLSATAWNNRLARAYGQRLVYRVPEVLLNGGRQYVYETLIDKS